MCLQDLAIGRRLTAKTYQVVGDTAGVLGLPARKDRVSLSIALYGWASTVSVGVKLQDGTFFPLWTAVLWDGGTAQAITPPSALLSVKDYGDLITGEIYVFSDAGSTAYIAEVFPLPELSEAVAKEVKRAF